MNLYDRFLQFENLCDLIRRKATGTPDQLAEKLHISRGTVYKLLEEIESYGAEIEYDRNRKCFCFTKGIDIKFEVTHVSRKI